MTWWLWVLAGVGVWILASLVFLLVWVGVSLLQGWHLTRAARKAIADIRAAKQ